MNNQSVSNAFKTFGEEASGHAQVWMEAVQNLLVYLFRRYV